MRLRTIFVAAGLVALLVVALPVFAAADTEAALGYLRTQQNADGGLGSGFSPESAPGSTADAMLAIVAVGGDVLTFDQAGNTPLTYLTNHAAMAATGGDLAKVVMAAIAMGENPRQFGGLDLVSRLEGMVGADGRIGTELDTFVGHCLSVLALASAQRPIPPAAVEYIKAAQQESGAWAWDGSAATAGDTNSTAFAVQALMAAGEPADSEPTVGALAYYKSIQNDDGGWPYQSPSDYGTDTDANSTAVSIQAIIATGDDPAGTEWASAEGNTPMMALESLQNESGAFAWQAAVPDDNLLATVQALPAVAGKAFPLATMAVGEAAVTAPSIVPETGGAALGQLLVLLLGGAALAGAGYLLRRKR